MSEENKTRDAVEAVKGLVEAIPIYQDVLQPAAKEVGAGLQTIAKTVHIVLAPIGAMVWGYEKIRDYLQSSISDKLKMVPEERIITPPPHVAVPAIEALRYTGGEKELRNMYSNLLATSMDKETVKYAHPAFVEIIKNMAPDEAKIISLFATTQSFPAIDIEARERGKTSRLTVIKNYTHIPNVASCLFPDMTPEYLDNLCRLGLIEIPSGIYLITPGIYDLLEKDPFVESWKLSIDKEFDKDPYIERKVLRVTEMGKQFCKACVIERTV